MIGGLTYPTMDFGAGFLVFNYANEIWLGFALLHQAHAFLPQSLFTYLLDIFIGVRDKYKLVIEDSLIVQFILPILSRSRESPVFEM